MSVLSQNLVRRLVRRLVRSSRQKRPNLGRANQVQLPSWALVVSLLARLRSFFVFLTNLGRFPTPWLMSSGLHLSPVCRQISKCIKSLVLHATGSVVHLSFQSLKSSVSFTSSPRFTLDIEISCLDSQQM